MALEDAQGHFDPKKGEPLVGYISPVDIKAALTQTYADFEAADDGLQAILDGLPKGPPGPTGPTGPQGVQGEQGVAGPTGPIGPIGFTGPQGPQGPTGQGVVIKGSAATADALPTANNNEGDIYVVQGGDLFVWSGGAWVLLGKLAGVDGATGPPGPAGPAGAPGDPGPPGPAGVQGIQGIQGVPGPVGPTGAVGLRGVKGDQGDVGPPGPTGPIGPVWTETYTVQNTYAGLLALMAEVSK